MTKISAPNDAIYAPVGNNLQESSLKKVVGFTPKCPRKLSPVIVKNARTNMEKSPCLKNVIFLVKKFQESKNPGLYFRFHFVLGPREIDTFLSKIYIFRFFSRNFFPASLHRFDLFHSTVQHMYFYRIVHRMYFTVLCT